MHRWLPVLLLVSGCAFGITGPDPDRPRSQMPKCDTGKGLVMLDGVMAATAGVIAISLAGETEPAVALLPLSIGAIYAGGAIRGNSNANKCRKAMGEWESYMAARETLPPGADVLPLPEPRRMPPPPRVIGPRGPASGPEPEVASTQQSAAVPPMPVAVTPPLAAPPIASPTAAPPAAPQASQPRPAAKPAKPAPPPPKDDEWADFWREVE